MMKYRLSAATLLGGALLLAGLAGCNPSTPETGTTTTTTTSTSTTTSTMTTTGTPGAMESGNTMTSASPASTESAGAMTGESPMAAGTGAPASGSPVPMTAANGTTVKIQVSDTAIQMPDALPAGTVSFAVNNTGKSKHSLEIKGDGVDKKLDAPVEAGASQTLQVDLKAGTYEVTDPDNASIKSTLTVK